MSASRHETDPIVKTTIRKLPDRTSRADWGINLDPLISALGPKVWLHRGTPIAGMTMANRFLLSAAMLDCDIYAHSPMSHLIGNKLADSEETRGKTAAVIDQLVSEVDFPDVRFLINGGKIGFSQVLKLRQKAKRFRQWLQNESERDRNALFAYHHEVAKDSDLLAGRRKALRLFGYLSTVATTAFIPTDHVTTAAAGVALTKLTDFIASKLDTDWRPVVFGDSAREFVDGELRPDQRT